MKVVKLQESTSTVFRLTDDIVDRESAAISDYRKFANISEDFRITNKNLDNWALSQTCLKHNYPKFDFKNIILREGAEDKTLEQAAREIDAEAEEIESKSELESILDRSLKIALRKQRRGDKGDFPNIMIEGPAGFGKTEIVRQWAQKNDVQLFELNLGQAGPEHIGGLVSYDPEDPNFVKPLANKQLIYALERPRSVLFLDEYNRSKNTIRGTILDLVASHVIPDGTSGTKDGGTGKRFLPNFLFTIGAMNPNTAGYRGVDSLDNAEKTRFTHYPSTPNPFEHLKYLKSYYASTIKDAEENGDEEEVLEEKGKLALATAILSDPKFHYTTPETEEKHDDEGNSFHPTNYRSLKSVLDRSDGTKDDLLRIWNSVCDYTQKNLIDDILSDYVDIQDKANDVLRDGTESSVFNNTGANAWETLLKSYPELADED